MSPPLVGIEPTTSRFYAVTLYVHAPRLASNAEYFFGLLYSNIINLLVPHFIKGRQEEHRMYTHFVDAVSLCNDDPKFILFLSIHLYQS